MWSRSPLGPPGRAKRLGNREGRVLEADGRADWKVGPFPGLGTGRVEGWVGGRVNESEDVGGGREDRRLHLEDQSIPAARCAR